MSTPEERFKKNVETAKKSRLVIENTERFSEMKKKAESGDEAAKKWYYWGVHDLGNQAAEGNDFSAAVLENLGEPLPKLEKKEGS